MRKNFEKIKEDADLVLSAKSSHPEQTAFVIKSMLSMLEMMMMVFLEKKVRKNSSNSGLPPSYEFGTNGNRNKKKPKTHKNVGSLSDNSKFETSKETLSPETCEHCDADLGDSRVLAKDAREIMDLEYSVKIKTYEAETKKCPHCGEKTKAKFPEGLESRFQYGIGIKSSIVDFIAVQMISFQRVSEHFKGITGRWISPSTMLKSLALLGEKLKEWEDKAKQELLKAPVVYIDETSMRVNKANHWIHTASYGDIVLQIIHPERGIEGIKSMGILDEYGGIIVHDFWKSYLAFEKLKHGFCVAHLMRELKFTEESTNYYWPTKMKDLLKEAVIKVNSKKRRILTKKDRQALEKEYEDILIEGLAEMHVEPPVILGKKGKPKHTDTQNLWMRLFDYKDSVLLFTKVKEVDATNNRAERDLRMNKVKKKVSGCFRTQEMAQHFCRIYSYVKTMRNKNISSLQAITLAFKGQIPY